MNKKEVAEIKRLFTPDRTPITRICGCYVDADKNKKTKMKEAFLSLPEEEMFKYFEILKKTLSGTIGRNLLDMEFPLTEETGGGAQEYLMQLKKSQLKDDELLDEFYDKIIENFLYPENYYIVIVHGAYDIPKKASDGIEMFDASDDVYEFLLCSICPVKLTKPGLCYNEDTNAIEERIRDWFVEAPVTGFLFPAFTDRNTDIHSVLYYSKNPEELNADFARLLLGCELPLTASSQKETFNTLICETLQGECTYETVKTIHQELNDLLDERKDDPNPPALDKNDVKRLLMENGATEETLEHFEEEFEQSGGNNQTALYVSNVVNRRKFEIKTPNIVISVKPECADLIETRMLEGRPYFVIPADDSVEVNGIPVHTMQRQDEDSTEAI
ncbi:DUF4317 domain-containing protein [Parablautia sp. Marseille-Q6255]|uniref:DUF4317 domain-containing protein n=1 Tax=Parablautia sp. Marseille-Q6255 TaxID=3039593 RepID=UPI0024BD5C73|nr:DUF4317 domain-containing protein [Parablautia sp. Marseille-Q6255]